MKKPFIFWRCCWYWRSRSELVRRLLLMSQPHRRQIPEVMRMRMPIWTKKCPWKVRQSPSSQPAARNNARSSKRTLADFEAKTGIDVVVERIW